jgi:ribonuclease Z
MKRLFIGLVFVGSVWLALDVTMAQAAPCLIVTLTGTHGGPQQPFNGLASAGTLVRYGDDANNCGTVKLQFDAGRGTTMRLSQLGIGTEELNAVFFTHMHTDHTEGFLDLVLSRWAFHAQVRRSMWSAVLMPFRRRGSRLAAGTSSHTWPMRSSNPEKSRNGIQRSKNARQVVRQNWTFDPKDEPQLVWSSGDVRVSAIRSTHILGHASYRVDTPAGSVVIGGDAVNNVLAPPRKYSTSDQVERLAKGADIIVHSAIHPIMGPGMGSDMYPYAFYRQSTATDIGAMAQRDGAKYSCLRI